MKGALRTGVGEHVLPPEETSYNKATVSAAARLTDELVDAGGLLRTFVENMQATVRAVDTLPEAIKEAITRARQSVASAEQIAGQTRGAGGRVTAAGSAEEAAAINALRTQRLAARIAQAPTPAAAAPPAEIRTVSAEQISQAGVDRIVNALEAQTRALIEGLRGRGGPGGPEEPPPPGTPPGAPPGAPRPPAGPVELSEAEKRAIEEHPKTQLALAEGLVADLRAADQNNEEVRSLLEAATRKRDELAATVAKMEREETGKTRAEQSAERRAAAAAEREVVPAMTRSEAAARQQDLERILRVGTDDFVEQVKRRGAEGISKTELQSTLEAFRKVGIEVAGGRTKEAIGANLQEAFARYRTQFGETTPEQLRTGGKILAEDKISDEVRAMAGSVEHILVNANQKLDALEALERNRLGGGGRPFKGAPEYGAGTFGPGVPGESLTTRGAVVNAREILRVLPEQMRAAAFGQFQQMIGREGFNPYAQELGAGVQGTGEQATAYRLMLGALRDLTTAEDQAARDFYATSRALVESQAFIERARVRIERNSEIAANSQSSARIEQARQEILADEQKIEEAYGHIARNTTKLDAEFSAASRELFGSLAFQRGFAVREGAGYLQAGEGAMTGERQAFEARRDARLGPSLRQDLKEGVAEGLIGIRRAIGVDEIVRNVPGATVRRGIVEPIDFATMGREDIISLRQASQHAGAAQANLRLLEAAARGGIGAQGPMTEAQAAEVHEAAAHLENAGTRLLNEMQRLFHVAPPLRAVTGTEQVFDPGNARMEFQRQLVREAQQERASRVFRTTEAQRLSQARSRVETTQKALAATTEARVQAEAAAAEATRAYETAEREMQGQLTAAQKKEIAALQQQARAAEVASFKAGMALPTAPGLATPGAGGGRYLPGSLIGNVLANLGGAQARLPTELQARMTHFGPGFRDVYGRIAQGPLPRQLTQEAVAAATYGRAPVGPLTEKQTRAGTAIQSLQEEEATLGRVEARLAELLRLPVEVVRANETAQRDLLAVADAENAYTRALERNQAELQRVRDQQYQAAALNQARVQGLKTREGETISRKMIGEQLGLKPEQITDILGPARQSVRDKQLAAANEKIQQALGETATAEEKAATVKKQAAEVTRQLTAAEESELAAKRRERAAIRASGTPYTRGAAKDLEEQAAAAERAAAARRGVATRFANAEDERAAAARVAAETATAEATALREQATAARQAQQDVAALTRRIRELERAAGAGGAGGGRRPPAPPTGPGDGDELGILRRILAALNQIHGTLEGGINVRGITGGTTGLLAAQMDTPAARARALTAPVAETRAARGASAEDEAILAAAQAAREQAIGGLRESDLAYAQEQATKENNARATEAATRADIEKARANQLVIDSLNQLSRAARFEIEVLRQLNATGASAVTIANQEARVFNEVSNSLARQGGVTAADRAQVAQRALAAAGSNVDSRQLAAIAQSARAKTAFVDIGSSYGQSMGEGVKRGFARIFSRGGGSGGFFDRIINTTGTFIVRNFAAGVVFGLTNELQTAVSDAIKTQQTYVRLSSTLQATGKDTGNLRVELQSLSSSYGVALNDLYDTAAKLAGVFDTPMDLENGTRTVAQLQQISEGALDANEAVGVLTSIWAAFQDELAQEGGAEHVADVATALQNLTGVNIEDTVEGVARLAGLAKQMGISFDETATFVAQISRETNVTGATAGEQLSRILEQARGAGGQAALKEALGADVFSRNSVNGAINYGNVLKDLVSNWDNLSQAQQANLTHALAGTRQAATFNALMDNSTKTLSNLAKAENSQGAAADRMAQLMKTLSGETARFRSNFQNLVNELVQTGLLDGLGAVLHIVNLLLQSFNHLLALLNHVGEINPFIGGLIHMTAAIGGAVLAAKVLVITIQGLRAAIKTEGAASALGLGFGGPIGGGGIAGARGKQATAATAEAASEVVLTEANSGLEVARARQIAAAAAETGVEAELIAAEEGLALATARQAAARTAATAVEAETAAAEAAGGVTGAARGGILGRLFGGGLRGTAGRLLGAARAAPGVTGALGAGVVILAAERGQLGRVGEAQTVTGARIKPGATPEELRVYADTYAKAAATAQGNINRGLFGTGIGTGVSVAMDRLIRGGAPYEAARTNAGNQQAIAVSLRHSADALERINERNQRQLERGETGAGAPVITSFDSDTLSKQLEDLTAHGQSAAQIFGELSDALFGVGESAKRATGAFMVGGRPTNNLGDWIDAQAPGLLKIGAGAGLDVSTLQARLRQMLGVERVVTGVSQGAGPTTPGAGALAYRFGARPAAPTLTTSIQQLPRSSYRAQNTAQAIDQAQRILEQQAAPDVNRKIEGFQARYADLIKRGFTDEAETYARVHHQLNTFFRKDRQSLDVLMGQARLTHKDAFTAVGLLEQQFQSALSALPETDLTGRTALNKQNVADIRRIIAKTKGATPTELINQLQQAENSLAEAQVAELDRARIAAQAADHSKAGLRAAAEKEMHAAIRIALRHGDADLLAQVIQNTGKAGQVLAISAIRQMQQQLNAYKQAQAMMARAAAAGNAVISEAITSGQIGGPKRPGFDQKQINQLLQAARIPTGKTSESAWFTGEGVPGIEDAQSAAKDAAADANQLRQDRAALLQARLGVRAAYADAHGDAVRAAEIQVQIAAAQKRAAQADLAAAKTQSERLQALTAIAGAEAQLIAAHAQVAQAHADLVSSQYDVAIALAEAAGHTVDAAIERAHQANAALRAALRKSGGKRTAEVNAARVGAIQAEAALRDARLQDELDTIDFNLQMGRITQSSAIHALQHILATENLTKEQRRQLLLQIKGMKDELADSQWNFGDIKLPTPYQMRRYIEQRKRQFRGELDAAAAGGRGGRLGDLGSSLDRVGQVNNQVTHITIDGADIGMIRKVLREVVGGRVNVRTTAPRRGNR